MGRNAYVLNGRMPAYRVARLHLNAALLALFCLFFKFESSSLTPTLEIWIVKIRAKVMQIATTAFVVVLLGGAANALDWTDFKSCTAECVAVSWYTQCNRLSFFN